MKEREEKEREEKERLELYSEGQQLNGKGQAEQNNILSTCISLLWNLAPFVLFASFVFIVQLVINSS